MDVTTLLIALAALLAGAGAGWLLGRSRGAADGASAAAAATATLETERRLTAERLDRAAADQQRIAAEFESLATRVLRTTSEDFLQLADQRMRQTAQESAAELAKREQAVATMVEPLKTTLGKVEAQLLDLETRRARAEAELGEQVRQLLGNNEQLRSETASLVNALRAPQARGRWGEMQLRRIVELSGMSARVDFDEQVTVGAADDRLRPDLVVRLAGGKQVVVDSKVSLAAYLEAHEATEPGRVEDRLQAHARHLRKHVNDLAGKTYWNQFSPAPEFVVLFIPGEAFLAPALEREPGLLEEAMGKRVIIATPATLIAMLRTISYAWQQEALGEKAQQVFDLGRELYDRLGKLGEHIAKLGRSINRVADDYNSALGTLERRVLVTARKLNDLDVVDGELAPLQPIDGAGARTPLAVELIEPPAGPAQLRALGAAEEEQDPRYGVNPPPRSESATG